MTQLHSSILSHATAVVREESQFCIGMQPAVRLQRFLALTEAELASRLRHKFANLTTILHAQGARSERDIQSETPKFKIEVKYWGGEVSQGIAPAVKDWNWLVGNDDMAYEKFWVVFFPQACTTVAGKKQTVPCKPGARRFQMGLSWYADPNCPEEWQPYWAVAEAARPLQRRAGVAGPAHCSEYALRFRTTIPLRQSLVANGKTVIAELCGNPDMDSLWAVVFAVDSSGTPGPACAPTHVDE